MIFPKEILENDTSSYIFKTQVRTKVIYILLLLVLCSCLIGLKYLYTDIHLSSRGILTSNEPREILVSPKSGYIEESRISFNKSVAKGDTLLGFSTTIIDNQIEAVKSKMILSEENIEDLNYLLFAKSPTINFLKRSRYIEELSQFKQRTKLIESKIIAQKTILERQESLFKQNVISVAEIQKHRVDLSILEEEKSFLEQERKSIYAKERQLENIQLLSLKTELKNLIEDRSTYWLVAQKSGSLLNVKEVSTGKFLNAGESIGEISTNSQLIAELYCPPSKIGLIKESDSVKFQIDAFNYRNWGFAKGKILDISDDIMIYENQLVFKITASVHEKNLKLKNGALGELKKGLTLNARIKIANRSLLDLLYDKIDNWVNPNQNQLSQAQ